MNQTKQHSGPENQLLIQTLTPAAQSSLPTLVRKIADAGCSLVDARAHTLGSDLGTELLVQGNWNAIAKLETIMARLAREMELHLTMYRTSPRPPQRHLLPYMVEVVAADRHGVLAELIDFFVVHKLSIEQLASQRYQAMQTGAEMFSAQITLGIPDENHIAALRDEFLELCDRLNLDAVMEPIKF